VAAGAALDDDAGVAVDEDAHGGSGELGVGGGGPRISARRSMAAR
jgi:hypothetical protein